MEKLSLPKVIIYTTESCPYCRQAERLLTAKNIAYTEIRVDQDAALKEEMMTRSGRRSVPQIFINDQSIGGFDDMVALEKTGELDILLKQV